jgi:hypothetical protein
VKVSMLACSCTYDWHTVITIFIFILVLVPVKFNGFSACFHQNKTLFMNLNKYILTQNTNWYFMEKLGVPEISGCHNLLLSSQKVPPFEMHLEK